MFENFAGFITLLITYLTGFCHASSDFGYHGIKGPEHWVDVLEYDSCAGKLQSPIDIQEHLLVPIRFTPLKFRRFNIFPNSMMISNNGHTVVLEFMSGDTATVSGGPLKGEYVFSQLHFHWGANDSIGSENRINNHSFPMELHMVFYKKEYGDKAKAMHYKDGLAVFAVFYQVSDFENIVYADIVQHLPEVTQPHSTVKLLVPLTLDSLLPANKYHYFTYNGSLTTPPCSEVVTWLDFTEPIFLSHEQVAEFRKLRSPDGILTENFRPVQPLEGRTVYYNIGERPFSFRPHYRTRSERNGAAPLCDHLYLMLVLLLRGMNDFS